jgi:methoxymalonate biosynthesis acyl carrier protein
VVSQRPSELAITVEEIIDDLRAFFSPATGGDVPGPDDDYFALGLVNSLLALELVAHVEQQFDIAVEVDDLDLDNFRTMNRTAAFILAKRSTRPA